MSVKNCNPVLHPKRQQDRTQQIDEFITDNVHYDEKYFDWQKSLGRFAGWASLDMFSSYISKEDEVLDFGCGGGYVLRIH